MPHRIKALQLIRDYQPLCAEESLARKRIEEFILSNDDCFSRTNLAGHLTASAWILNQSATKALLTHHKKIGSWIQLGGHADGEADLRAVALREAFEESGIAGIKPMDMGVFDLDVHYIEPYKDTPGHFHYDVRFLLKAPHEHFTVSPESFDLAWVELPVLASNMDFSATVRRMAIKSLEFAMERDKEMSDCSR